MIVERGHLFLGVDGGQSHTEAVIADENGKILGRGFGGPSNHAEQPGGRERLRGAVINAVGSALKIVDNSDRTEADLVAHSRFRSAHFGMTGGADFKKEVIDKAVNADLLSVGHDAPTALFGATAGEPGVVVIAGTGSVVYADNGNGRTAQVGGMGYLFSDEGSGFWLSAQMIRLAIKEADGSIADAGLSQAVLSHFDKPRLVDVVNGFYNGVITRDEIARLSRVAHGMALSGNRALRDVIKTGAEVLAEGVTTAAKRVGFENDFLVSYCGGMFNAALMGEFFRIAISECAPLAVLKEPVYGPTIGALFLAYRQAGVAIAKTVGDTVQFSQTQ